MECAYRIRRATVEDAAVIARHRVGMFRDMRVMVEVEAPLLETAAHAYLLATLSTGEYLGWLVEHDSGVVAGGGVILRALLPRPGHADGGEEAYVLNVYTEPPHRRRGLARRLMNEILDWCHARGALRITLHASDEGRPLYEDLGFVQTNEMRLDARGLA